MPSREDERGKGDVSNLLLNWVFTTNGDLCFKQWLEYGPREKFEDGIKLDVQRKPVLDPNEGWTKDSEIRKIVPLHGGFDLIKVSRIVPGGF